jgi:uncharacterized protein YjbJ (UPF0337 family)
LFAPSIPTSADGRRRKSEEKQYMRLKWPNEVLTVLIQVSGAQSSGAAGKVVGDAKLEAEGKADRAEGKVQNAVGGLKATLRKA